MDEKNKKEKTFSDLFTSVNTTNQNNKPIDFNNNNQNNNTTSESIFSTALPKKNQAESSKEISFSDLTSDTKIDTKNESKDINNLNTKLEEHNPNPNIFNQLEKSIHNELNQEPEPQTSNSSIFAPPKEPDQLIKPEASNNETIERDDITKSSDIFSKNSIFDNQEQDNYSESGTNQFEDTAKNDITTPEITSNPFFESNDHSIFNNQEEKELDTSDIDSTIEQASFPPKKNQSNLELQKEEEQTTKTIFDNTPKMSQDNPFFQKDESKILIDDKKTSTLKEETSPFFEKESSSPFFEEGHQDESLNPLFDNKINLIENKNHSTTSPTGKIDTSTIKNFNVKIVKKKEPLIKFILGVLSYAVFIWLLLIGITLLIYVADIKIRAAKGDNSPPKYNAYVVLTGSMLPEIQVYDVVITKKVDPKDLEKGDVITFASSDTRFLNTIITHRIIKKNYNAETNTYTFQTKGDNNNVADSALVETNNIHGKVIFKIPKLGYLQEFLATDGGWIIVILIPCLAVISYDIVKLIKGLKRKKYKNIKVQK